MLLASGHVMREESTLSCAVLLRVKCKRNMLSHTARLWELKSFSTRFVSCRYYDGNGMNEDAMMRRDAAAQRTARPYTYVRAKVEPASLDPEGSGSRVERHISSSHLASSFSRGSIPDPYSALLSFLLLLCLLPS